MVTLILIGFLGGLITGVSPCVLPMLPVIFFAGGSGTADAGQPGTTATRVPAFATVGGPAPDSRSAATGPGTVGDRPRRSRRPLKIIAGLILSFSVFTLAGSFLLTALGLPQDFLRWAGLVVLSIIGLGLIFPRVEEIIQRPFARLPKINRRGVDGNAFVLGLGLGTLYVPCAGPVLAAITVAGTTGRIDARIVELTVSFAVGVAVPLFFFALAGNRIGARLTAYRTRARKFRLAGGVLMIALAIALAFNLTDVLQRALPNYTQGLQNQVESNDTAKGALAQLGNDTPSQAQDCKSGATTLMNCGKAPSIVGITQWFNTPGNRPLTLTGLKGKVVLVDFWTYSCINCQRTLPYVEAWDKAYAAAGLQVIGVHTPEFSFEKVPSNVAAGIKQLGVHYPVAMDNSAQTWTNYHNSYWPAEYLIDATGTVRHVNFGEGDYAGTEGLIRQLLAQESPDTALPAPTDAAVPAAVVSGATTPETYLASGRSDGYDGSTPLTPGTATFAFPSTLPADAYGLSGRWLVATQNLTAVGPASIRINYQANHIYAVLGGVGQATVLRNGRQVSQFATGSQPRLYPLFQDAADSRATLTLQVTSGVQAFTFTFG